MHFFSRSKLSILFSFVTIAVVVGGFAVTGVIRGHTTGAHAANTPMHLNCAQGSSFCTEVNDSEAVFGENVYVGHDEPSNLFYSNVPGSGNRMRYQLTLPKDPSTSLASTPGVGYNFQLHPAFWFGMAMCDTQSYPEQLTGCTPNSDTNIVDPAVSPAHPGTAFMEMQFYPPGWVKWPGGNSCDPTKWCAALNIDSLSQNPVTGQSLNPTCAATTGVEYVNFAFMTKSGTPQPNSPPNPVNATLSTFTPDPNADLFMNSGDKLVVTLHDTASGLQIDINDKTTRQTGSMTTSAANGFGQVQFAPTGTTCNNIPYDFHPMYSTSSELTRVPWAAHSYNIAFSDEIGHWDYCTGSTTIPTTAFGAACPGTNMEGVANDKEATDADDAGCFPSTSSSLVQVSGCLVASNTGFDGVPYQPVWPDGNTTLHPTSLLFTSPLTGSGYSVKYSRSAFETDLPRIETAGFTSSPNPCNRSTGAGCTLIPNTDDGRAAVFYPFFSIANRSGKCVWQLGNHIPGSKNDFGQNGQYGTLLQLTYTTVGGGPITIIEDFRQILSKNPC